MARPRDQRIKDTLELLQTEVDVWIATASGAGGPVNQTAPTVSGTAKAGETLTATNGTWTPAPTSYTYAWQRCSETSTACANIDGATHAIGRGLHRGALVIYETTLPVGTTRGRLGPMLEEASGMKAGRDFQLEEVDREAEILINGKKKRRARLANGDRITLGRALLGFSMFTELPSTPEAETTGSGIVDRLQAGASKLVRIQRADATGTDRASVVARVTAAALRNDLNEARRELNALAPADRAAAQGWLDKADARDAALAASRQFATEAMAALAKVRQ